MNRIIQIIRRRWLYVLGIAALLVLALFAVLPQAVSVEVAVVDRGTVRASLVDEGRTRMREVYVVSAPVSGRLLRVAVEAGDRVQKGEPLARMTRGASGFLDPRSDAEASRIRITYNDDITRRFVWASVAFGIVGIFVGPVVLAVAYTLLDDWVSADPPDSATAAPTVDGQ